MMKLKFEIELYEDFIEDPFRVDDYFNQRINIYTIEKGYALDFCTSTFNASILYDFAKGFIEIFEGTRQAFTVEMYESTLEFTFTYFQKLITVTRYEGFNGETIEMQKCRFDDFVEAFVNEYKKYHKYIAKNDPNAYDHEHFCMMRDQINILTNHLNKLI